MNRKVTAYVFASFCLGVVLTQCKLGRIEASELASLNGELSVYRLVSGTLHNPTNFDIIVDAQCDGKKYKSKVCPSASNCDDIFEVRLNQDCTVTSVYAKNLMKWEVFSKHQIDEAAQFQILRARAGK